MNDLELYRRVYLIRQAENAIVDNYSSDEMKTPVHLSIGEEGICAGVCGALSPEDQLVGTYRGHGIYLARTLETDRFFAEMYGRESGVAGGKAGSMHLSSPKHGLLGCSAVVATTIPMAVGAALANQVRKKPGVVAAFFGDGAIDEGVFYESLNFALVRRLPVLFVCGDNGLAIHAPASDRHGYERIGQVVQGFGCEVYESESTVAGEIHHLASKAVQKAKETSKPAFLHLKYYRYREHVGVFEDFDAGYRERSEFEAWKRRDPVVLQRQRTVEIFGEREVLQIERHVDADIASSVCKAQAASHPHAKALLTDVFFGQTMHEDSQRNIKIQYQGKEQSAA